MTRSFPKPVATLLVALASNSFVATAPAQVPDGYYVISAGRGLATGFTGDGGLYVAHPRTPQNMVAIANVPADLTRSGHNGPELLGANCVLVHPSGDLLVGERGTNGDVIELHRLTLDSTGTTVVVTHPPIALGTVPLGASSYGELAQMVLLDANTVLVGGNFVAGAIGPANALQVARVDLTTGAVTPIQGVTGLGLLNALAFDPATATTYLGCIYSTGLTYVRAFQPGTPITTIASGIPGSATCMAVDGSGELWVSISNGLSIGPPSLLRIHPQAPVTVTPLVSGWETFNALCIEPTTGQLGLCGRAYLGSPQSGVHWMDVGTNAVTWLADGLTSGPRGALTGIDMAPSPYRYGAPSGAGLHRWTATPHPLALPLAGGNWRFAVDWNGTVPVFSAAFFALSPSPFLPLPVPLPLGIDAWIDLGSLLGSVPLVLNPALNQSEATIALPPLLTGTFYLQEVHLDIGLLFGASDALRAAML